MQKTKQNNKTSKTALSETEMQILAHTGTKEAILKLEKYWQAEKDPEKKAYAEMALEECELFYYQPVNQKEEKDFELCVLISKYNKRIDQALMEMARIKARLDWRKLEGEVHKKVLAKHKSQTEAWKYKHLNEFLGFEQDHLAELEEEHAYNQAFVKAAKDMIITPKYKEGIPERHLSHFDFDFADEEYDDDEFDCDCDD